MYSFVKLQTKKDFEEMVYNNSDTIKLVEKNCHKIKQLMIESKLQKKEL